MKISLLTFAVFGIALLPNASALTLDFVTIGDPGNGADSLNIGVVPEIGAVSSDFKLGTYEVTNAQYAEFLNKVDVTGANSLGLYDSQMGLTVTGGILFSVAASIGSKYSVKAGYENFPVVYVSFFDAARFTNWLHNGQGSGGTESGAYTLLGGSEVPTNAATASRSAGAQYWVPSESEWYKAAYYQPAAFGGDSDNYWLYPMRSNLVPFSDQPPGTTPDNTRVGNFFASDNLANGFNDGYAATGQTTIDGIQNNLTPVGAYTGTAGYYGTRDQGGNVAEWTDTHDGAGNRNVRGGSWDVTSSLQQSGTRIFLDGTGAGNAFGFRVAAIPEPTSIGMLLLGTVQLGSRRRALR